jgi:hypothetical protein
MRAAAVSTPSMPRYTTAVCKGSGLLSEMKALLRAWQPGESAVHFRARVLKEDILAKATAKRANDLVDRVFAPRFLRDNGKPARYLQRLLASRVSSAAFSDLCFLYTVRQDDLLRDVLERVYWPMVRKGYLTLNDGSILLFLQSESARERIIEPWSQYVERRVARGTLRVMTDFGLLHPIRKGRREVRRYHPSDTLIVFLAYELRHSGFTDAGVVAHPDWAIFGMQRPDVVSRMDRLSTDGWWIMQAAGSLVRVTWKYGSMDEVVNALAG